MSPSKPSPTVVSTFAGCGGSSMGWKLAGFRVLMAVEWDKHAAATYSRNHVGTILHEGDVAKLSVADVLKATGLEAGELDVLDGSPPCQGFSVSGRLAMEDPRNQLFRHFVRLLKGLKPRAFVMENVPGMVKGKMRLVFAQILKDLKGAGYQVSARVLDASWYGVPRRRNRVIFIGARADLGIEPEHPEPFGRPISISEALAGLDPGPATKFLKGQALDIWCKTKPGKNFAKHHPKGHWFNSIKADPFAPCPTLTAKVMEMGASGIFRWKWPRILTIAEAKRCASFPDEFVLEGRFKDQWARLGNSVPPLLMKAVAAQVRRQIIGR